VADNHLGPRSETLMANDAAGRWLDELTPASSGRSRELPLAVHQVAAGRSRRAGRAVQVPDP
jgi:hypothetical protein